MIRVLIPLSMFVIIMLGCKLPFKTVNQQSYKDRMEYCKANAEIKTATIAGSEQVMTMKWVPENCIIGAPLPIFETQTLNGEKIDASYFKNKMTIINFWFESCPPCIAKIPALNKLKHKYKNYNINFLAIGKDTKKDIESFIAENPFGFDLVANGEQIKRETFLSPWGYPLTIVVNKKGLIIEAYSGGKSDSTAFEQTLKKLEPLIIKEHGLVNGNSAKNEKPK